MCPNLFPFASARCLLHSRLFIDDENNVGYTNRSGRPPADVGFRNSRRLNGFWRPARACCNAVHFSRRYAVSSNPARDPLLCNSFDPDAPFRYRLTALCVVALLKEVVLLRSQRMFLTFPLYAVVYDENVASRVQNSCYANLLSHL